MTHSNDRESRRRNREARTQLLEMQLHGAKVAADESAALNHRLSPEAKFRILTAIALNPYAPPSERIAAIHEHSMLDGSHKAPDTGRESSAQVNLFLQLPREQRLERLNTLGPSAAAAISHDETTPQPADHDPTFSDDDEAPIE